MQMRCRPQCPWGSSSLPPYQMNPLRCACCLLPAEKEERRKKREAQAEEKRRAEEEKAAAAAATAAAAGGDAAAAGQVRLGGAGTGHGGLGRLSLSPVPSRLSGAQKEVHGAGGPWLSARAARRARAAPCTCTTQQAERAEQGSGRTHRPPPRLLVCRTAPRPPLPPPSPPLPPRRPPRHRRLSPRLNSQRSCRWVEWGRAGQGQVGSWVQGGGGNHKEQRKLSFRFPSGFSECIGFFQHMKLLKTAGGRGGTAAGQGRAGRC